MGISASFSDFSFLIAFGILFAYLVMDALYAYYTLKVTQFSEYSAATTGIVVHLLLALGVISYTNNFLYIIPIMIGSWIGTFIVIRRERIKKNK